MIDLATWNLSIPVGVPATTIDTPLLVGGYQDHYFQSKDGAIFFWAPVNGSTTENAKYPRSELRETFADGKLRNWTYPSADNFLRAALAISQVPSTGKLVIGQIHAQQSSAPLLKLEYQYKAYLASGNIVAKLRLSPDAPIQVITIARHIELNQRFTYAIHLTPKGTLSISLNDINWNSPIDSAWAAKSLYFKAGAYPQDNSGYETEAGAAQFYKLGIEHRALASPAP
ncbi:polysaccharide lyase family 7 protein [Pseudomonas sp. MMS21-TM103]|uniref:polysaccharide lyase family 7 protein n=1 Tax=Pseudomonas sp. MMS21 TM103 TaxID=2886506 RepID=UPI001EDF1145|nr:polysaccharide lyase family 7 protein [Pseudomonas sp. MMS21 TM103]MCG4455417.1 polysaccharide lyase family 7 protein [Pseudomonas sp. MMS21 TM103]